jgi:hypothetical protein
MILTRVALKLMPGLGAVTVPRPPYAMRLLMTILYVTKKNPRWGSICYHPENK